MALALVAVLAVYALSFHARVARALVDILVAEFPSPAGIAIAIESVEFVLALAVHAGIGQALVDLSLAVTSGVSRMATANVRMMSDRVLGEGAASGPRPLGAGACGGVGWLPSRVVIAAVIIVTGPRSAARLVSTAWNLARLVFSAWKIVTRVTR
jgi:hypothetical protein